MLGWPLPPGAPYQDAIPFIDPNGEHPPLGKALIAGSMLIFGDNGLGWRLPSLIAAIIGLLALYGIVRAAGGKPWTAVLATALYSLDILSFIHGRIGVLDMMMVAFLLTGAWLWLTDRWVLAGSALALATLIKLPGGYGLVAAIAWQAVGLWRASREGQTIGWRELRPTAGLLGAYAAVFLFGLWLLDLRFTQFTSPFAHISNMLSYGFALQQTYNPSGISSAPWEWLVNGGQFDYFKVAVNSLVNGEVVGSRPTVEFRALLNPVLLGSAPLAILYGGWLAWRRDNRLALWSLVWIAATYLPYWVLAIFANRITYFYYVLPVVPALAAVTAAFLVQSRLPRIVVWGYITACVVAFIAYFPFREIPTS
jgi:dolichyl-phosphate-mannose-protein mannosyltransferase